MEDTFEIDKYNKNEFKVVTVVLAIFLLNLINEVTVGNGSGLSQELVVAFATKGISLSYMENHFLPWLFRYLALYGVYALAHFYIIKKLVNQVDVSTNIILSVLLFVALVGIWTWSAAWINYYLLFDQDNDKTILDGNVWFRLLGKSLITIFWIAAAFALYSYLKYNKPKLFTFDASRITPLRRDVYVASIVWAIMYGVINYVAFWALPIIPVYLYLSVRLIPLVKGENKRFANYLARFSLIVFIIGALVFFTYAITVHRRVDDFFVVVLLYAAFHVFIIAPATWAIFHHRLAKNAEITGLKTALGQSSANLDFLRSQINPHFLFNALNTLYGTSIQEKAERTGEGIQKLGDMMRFMLHENMQEKISLMREVDYLKNYIDLQKLRTHASPEILIQTEIEESVNGLQIAPMLLIPFVENAFKHGISLREASHIKITLHTEGVKLFFDVHNSVHPKAGIDPEKNHTGIGLENVKQRLQLLYPDRHELMIRETSKEYFIHLTIEL